MTGSPTLVASGEGSHLPGELASEIENEPTVEQATAALLALASVFLPTGVEEARAAPAALSIPRASEPSAVVVVDQRGLVQAMDEHAERLWHLCATEAIGLPIEAILETTSMGQGGTGVAIGRDETRTSVLVSRHALRGQDRTSSVLLIRRADADERADARTQLRYRNLVEQIPAVVFTAALDGGQHDIYVGPQIENLLGYTQAEWLRNPVLWYERLHPDDRRLLDREFARGCATGGPFKAECRFIAADGRVVWVHGEARLIKDTAGYPLFLQGVAFDITETKRAEEMVRASLLEKELLLKEIHHRVKNNLQITSSLLRLQVAKTTDDGARQTLRESQDRIRSIALVHEMLYRAQDLSRVSFADYVRALVLQLFRSYNVVGRRVGHVVQIDRVELGIDVAVPYGLIVNELVANALKHAFPEGRAGEIQITMKAEPSHYVLTVRDDGVGMPPSLDWKHADTLGLQLVRALAAQLDGRLEVEVEVGRGTAVTLTVSRTGEAR
jgi:PAS domain S-box-containing protein